MESNHLDKFGRRRYEEHNNFSEIILHLPQWFSEDSVQRYQLFSGHVLLWSSDHQR